MAKIPDLTDIQPKTGDVVKPADIERALSGTRILFEDGAIQDFSPDGKTDYLERGGVWPGTWHVDGDAYCSIWPPSSYVACYTMNWVVDEGKVIGLSFTDRRNGDVFAGRYQE